MERSTSIIKGPAGCKTDNESTSEVVITSTIFVDPIIEKRALAKFDKFFLPQMALLVLIAYLDRTNIGNAKVFGFVEGIGLVGNEFNNISTVFYATYVACETPWVVCAKRYGANKVIAVAFVGWGLTTLGTGFITNYHQALAVRLLLGVFESCYIPTIIFMISSIYDRDAVAKRVAVLYIATTVSGAFGGLIAYGIQLMGARRGLAPWRWLFIIEGIISVVLCFAAWVTLPKNAENAWFLTEEEKAVMRARKERDVAFKGDEEGFSWKYAKMAVTEPLVYLAGCGSFCSSIPLLGFSTFLPTIIKGLGYTSYQANYLTIPVYALAGLVVASGSYLSDRINKRAVCLVLCPVPAIIGYIIVISSRNIGAGYFAMFMIASGIYMYNCLWATWISTNLAPDYKRSIALPLFISIANLSGIVSSQIYPASAAPRYVSGNAISLAMACMALIFVCIVFLLLRSRNLKKLILIAEGATDNGMPGDRALNFKYTL